MIQHVSLDMWGTLIKGNPAYKTYLAKSMKEYLEDTLKMKNVSGTYHIIKETESYINHCNSLSGGSMSLPQMFFLLLSRYGVKHREIKKSQIDFLTLLYNVAFRDFPPSFIDLEALKVTMNRARLRGVTFSICSNTSFITPAQLNVLLMRNGIEQKLNFSIFSGTVGISKPNEAIFARILYSLVTSKRKNVMHVGDCVKNDGACEGLGIRFLQVYGDSKNNISDILSNLD